MDDIAIFCADIGSVKKDNFGWAGIILSEPDCTLSGERMEDLAEEVSKALKEKRRVALGFECPLFVPLDSEPLKLTRKRKGEARPWSAGAGVAVLGTGLVQTTWLLNRIREGIQEQPPAFLDWPSFAESKNGLFLWEAFVTGSAKGETHVDDALVAVTAFKKALPDPCSVNIISEQAPLSLMGTVLLRTGWSNELSILSESCLVISP